MSRARRFILCADDFAQDDAVSIAVLRLVEAGRLSAVSCFTDAPQWRTFGRELVAGAEQVYLGVHFNLTHEFDRGAHALPFWIASTLARKIDGSAVLDHLRRQVDRFADVTGRLPDFIDGHQHVHAFPMIRSIVRDYVLALAQDHPVLVRNVSLPFGQTDAPFKRRVIQAMAAAGPDVSAGWSFYMNEAFGGDYSLRAKVDYAALFAQWLAAAPRCGGLIMCHPGVGGRDIDAAKAQELAFFSSGRFHELLGENRLELVRRTDRFPVERRLTRKSAML